MIDKRVAYAEAALADVRDGSTVMIRGFGTAGLPDELIEGLMSSGARELVIVNNSAGNGDIGLAALLAARRVRKIICSFPRQADSHHFDALYRAGQIELELVPQGNLAERTRTAGAGIGGFFTPTGYGTALAEGKKTREIDGRMRVLEHPIKAERGDRWGNLTYRMTARNFGPIMAMAATTTVARSWSSAAWTPKRSARRGCLCSGWCRCRAPSHKPAASSWRPEERSPDAVVGSCVQPAQRSKGIGLGGPPHRLGAHLPWRALSV